MASLTAAQIQTKIDLLNATYDTLAADAASSRSAGARSQTLQDIETIQKQIAYWEERLDRSTRAANTFTQGRPVQ